MVVGEALACNFAAQRLIESAYSRQLWIRHVLWIGRSVDERYCASRRTDTVGTTDRCIRSDVLMHGMPLLISIIAIVSTRNNEKDKILTMLWYRAVASALMLLIV